jgi:putative MATE family efflux protein
VSDEPEPRDPRVPENGRAAESDNPQDETSNDVRSSEWVARSSSEDALEAERAAASAVAVEGEMRVGRRGGGRGRRRRGAWVDPTTGSIPKKLGRMAWPQVAESILNIADQFVDLIWAGRLPGGFRAIAALGIAQSFTGFSRTVRQGLDMSMQAMISRAVGAGNVRLASHIALQAFSLNGVFSLLTIIVGIFLTDVMLRLIGASEAVQQETRLYMRIQFIGMATMSFRMMAGAALQSSGDVMTPLKATTVARLLHIALTPFLMFGWWWFPSLGLAGAALANVIAHLAGAGINFYALFRGDSRLHLTLRGYYVDYPLLWRMIKIGTPASIAATERTTAQLVLLAFVTPFGDVALAAFALTRRMEMFANFGAMGLGRATGIMVGQNLGAGQLSRARQAIGWGLMYVTVMKLVLGSVIFLFPVGLVMLFTDQADVVELAALWLRIQVIGTIFMGMGMIFQQSFNTSGDTMAPMIVTLLSMWFIELPLAWFLLNGTDIGVLGIAYARITSMSVRVALYVPYFYWGRWARIKVIA